MLDTFRRNINYLRVSVTDRCNLRCTYCMPEEGIKLMKHEDILSFDEIIEVVKKAVELGIDKVRITGGEPLVRKGIISLVKQISMIEGITDFGLTTNGILLEDFAVELRKAGLHRLNISLDTVDSDEFAKITRGGDINRVFRGIERAVTAGFDNIKLNTVIDSSPYEQNAAGVTEFARKNGFQIRYIRKMDLKKGKFWEVDGGEGGKCGSCNRLRISANGIVTPCLFSDIGYSVRELGIEKALTSAINSKPEKGIMSKSHQFYNLGG
ncbi:MAG TPA: radical SAM protein [bacterium]|nr:radical SAM protein [bacterium]HPS30303.1 radical SAM protein [bacterium]